MAFRAEHSWRPGPLEPRLAEGAVHVWRADLEAVTDDLLELLSCEEEARAARFLAERDRRLWGRAHGVLRAMLGRYLETDPRTPRLVVGSHGKPALDDAAGPARLSFNLSHSGQLALFAFTETGPVGVDVEFARRPIDEVAMATRTFGGAEAERLAGLDAATREWEFLRLWVRHEAELKFRGTGIGDATRSAEEREPWIVELEMGPRAAAAVAAQEPPDELHCWDWHSNWSTI
jgi:4'-phosphopantetheinyl transferase